MLDRNLCFKTYTKGSYFGDFEFFRNSCRMFSVRAEKPCVLMKVSSESLNEAFKVYRETKYIVMHKSFFRYLRYKKSIFQIFQYQSITMNDEYWKNDRKFTGIENTINIKIDRLFNNCLEEQKLKASLAKL